MVRIPIQLQLSLLVLFCSLLALMVLALATWFQSRDFVVGIRLSALSLTASLKAAELAGTLLLYESQVKSVATRVLVQSALQRYQAGNDTNENWSRTQSDISGALANGALLSQAVIFPAYDNGNKSDLSGLVNVTSSSVIGEIQLPYNYTNGTPVFLGDPGEGYPSDLYPVLTYHNATADTPYYVAADGLTLVPSSVLLLGPLIIDEETALLSATTAITNNTDQDQILGWLTVVINASMIYNTRDSQEGLGKTGEVLIVGPATKTNRFTFDIFAANASDIVPNTDVRFVLPPSNNASIRARHSSRVSPEDSADPFLASSFPAVVQAWTQDNHELNNAGADLSTHNEQNVQVSVGYAQVATPLVDWLVLVESSHGETVGPINDLRNIVLICVFSVTGALLILTFPLAHYSVAPIRALRAATKKSVEPYQPDDNQSGYSQSSATALDLGHDGAYDTDDSRSIGLFRTVTRWATGAKQRPLREKPHTGRKTFRIPMKVPERKHFIHDELTDLTTKFNEMSEELTLQYQRLEERVRERTAELEAAKKVAETANQSKTLFIANISHELKTPLNGILGLTTVCMNEDDPNKIKSTLNTIYKSGDLLLHLLTDLLTFSKNEVGQQISIDESEFRLHDLKTQLIPTFERQAREGQINLQVQYYGTQDQWGDSAAEERPYGPTGTGKVRDMYLWGDKNRILQVLMNFVSNSLKFTPPHGSVTVRIRCVGIADLTNISRTGSARKSSLASRKSKTSSTRVRTSDTSLVGGSSDSENERKTTRKPKVRDAKLNINVGGATTQLAQYVKRQRSKSPPPIMNAKDLEFEFEVEDTGPGIPEDQQKKIFEPFVQGDLGLSKKYGGTGLGLSICAQLASLMGGELFLDSQVGRGSKFSMRIPLVYISERPASIDSDRAKTVSRSSSVLAPSATEEPQSVRRRSSTVRTDGNISEVPRLVGLAQPYMAKEVTTTTTKKATADDLSLMKKAETEAAKSGSKVRVLVAEDNKINQEVVLRMLKLEDVYDVTIAKDGQEAFDKVRESMQCGQKFHLVFMDVQMPNVDGIQSTKMIRGMGFNAPIVALTAFAEKSNEDECMASGMDYFLAKPIRRPALKQVLKKYCTTIPEEESEGNTPPPVPNGTADHAATKEGAESNAITNGV